MISDSAFVDQAQECLDRGAVFGPIGYELNLLYIAGLITLALSGPSAVSVDRWLERRKVARDRS